MASVSTEKNGRRRIQFVGLDGKRQTLRPGKIPKREAEYVAGRIESILTTSAAGVPLERATADWLATLSDEFHAKLVAVGLVEPRIKSAPIVPEIIPIGPFAEAYLAKRTDMKEASRLVLGHVVRNLVDHFGADRDIKTVTAGEAEDFSRWLATQGRTRGKSSAGAKAKGLSPATIGKRLQWCSTIFRDAIKRKLITENPFVGIKQPKATNSARQFYVPAETIERLIESTPDAEWKLLLALSRFLGLRVPSEPFSLTWDCIDWEQSRIRVPSPKTEVHGKGFRVVPILPEIRPHLERLFDRAEAGEKFILKGLRSRGSAKSADEGFWANMNHRQQFLRLLERNGIKPWPKLFHNLRSSAQTDLASRFPIHVVCDWLGNTQAVAQEHYLQTTNAHFSEAIRGDSRNEATQNPTQNLHEPGRTDALSEAQKIKEPLENKGFSQKRIAGAGFEPTTSRL